MKAQKHKHSPGSLPGPENIMRVELPNGIVVLSRPNFESSSIMVSGYLQAGSLSDPDEKLGLSDFATGALMRGTSIHSFQEIYDQLESVGASLGFDSGTHVTGFGGRALVEDFDMLLELLSEVMCHPGFPPEHVERLRTQLLTGLAMRAQDTGDMASLAFDELVYTDHPYRRPEDGYVETVQAIQREDLVEFHRKNYGPRGMVIAVVGSLDPKQAVEKVARFLGGWQNPVLSDTPCLPPLFPLNGIARTKVDIPGKFQADIVMGVAGPSRFDQDYLPAALGNNILGQFGMMGRIGDIVREQAGLAYFAHSGLGGGPGPGPWTVVAGVAPQNVDRAIDLMIQEVKRINQELVTPEELADSQANFIGRLPLSLESNGGVAAALLNLERYKLGLDYYLRYADLINAITREQVKGSINHYLVPERLAIAIAGPS